MPVLPAKANVRALPKARVPAQARPAPVMPARAPAKPAAPVRGRPAVPNARGVAMRAPAATKALAKAPGQLRGR